MHICSPQGFVKKYSSASSLCTYMYLPQSSLNATLWLSYRELYRIRLKGSKQRLIWSCQYKRYINREARKNLEDTKVVITRRESVNGQIIQWQKEKNKTKGEEMVYTLNKRLDKTKPITFSSLKTTPRRISNNINNDKY